MSATPTGDFPCPHCGKFGPHFSCHQQPQYWYLPPPAAGHCGKCGAPYTTDMAAGIGPPKFIPSCKCWNVP